MTVCILRVFLEQCQRWLYNQEAGNHFGSLFFQSLHLRTSEHVTNCTEPSTRPRIRKGTRSSFYRKLSWDMETLMPRLELHKWWSLDPDHKYVLLRPHQNGSAFKVLRSVGVSELLVMIKLSAFRSVFSSNRLLLQQPELRRGGWHLSADGFSGVWCWTPERRRTSW